MSGNRAVICRCLVAAALVLSSGAGMALGTVTGYDQLSAHPEWLTGVQICGAWATAAQTGYFRVLTGTRHAQSLLFIDMVQVDPDSATPQVVRSFSVAELNNDHAEISLIGPLRCLPDGPGRVVVRSAAENGHDDGRRFDLCVQVDARRADDGARYQDSRAGVRATRLCRAVAPDRGKSAP